jgi:hypothetical protein
VDLDEAVQLLRACADAGDEYAAGRLADLLARRGQSDEAERLRRFGLNPRAGQSGGGYAASAAGSGGW